jgi:hypothetical protein
MGRHGRLDVGDGQRASQDPRARSAAAGDCSLCPLPQGQLHEGECDAALAAVGQGARVLSAVVRDGLQGQPAVSAEGDASPVAMRLKGAGQGESGTERRVVVRSGRQAPAAEAALRTRVAQALAQLEARNQRGAGTSALSP